MSEVVNQILHGDALAMLRTLADNSVDAICTDPPSSINFMGKSWDSDKGGRTQWVAWLTEIMREALRVLKPGGHAFVWALPRTSHWTALALEDAGFEIRDEVSHLFGGDSKAQTFMASLNDEQRNAFAQVIDGMNEPAALLHMFGSGFPKSANISAMIDKMMGKEPEVIGKATNGVGGISIAYEEGKLHGSALRSKQYDITKPATPEGEKWQGWHSALKPSHETWWLCRKPLAEPSIAANVLAWGCGALNIDASRINATSKTKFPAGYSKATGAAYAQDEYSKSWTATEDAHPSKRFPANTLLSHSWQCVPLGVKRVRGTAPRGKPSHGEVMMHSEGWGYKVNASGVHYNDSEGMEHVEAFQCAEDCPIFLLDQQSGVRKSGGGVKSKAGSVLNSPAHGRMEFKYDSPHCEPSEGGASRYFQNFHPDDMPPFLYTSKASRAERSKGCEALPERKKDTAYGEGFNSATKVRTAEQAENGVERGTTQNGHPTVKPLSLMSYLIRMITPPGGIVLDMFAGSGTTGVAAVQCGFRYILIEQEQEYIDIIRARLAHAHGAAPQEAQEVEYECAEDCPVKLIGEMSGVRKGASSNRNTGKSGFINKADGTQLIPGYNDTGTAARFFQTFPPGSLFEGMEDVNGEQESEQERVT